MDAQGILWNGRPDRMVVYPRYTLLERVLLGVVFAAGWPFRRVHLFLTEAWRKLEEWQEEDLIEL
ncbi:MAG: hypothetical protein A4E73_00636 [Syntrophaceae bacterium PtaU1.Bin231]|nr:MAG: hypothetical protein A4E73_00636 [Syntrophaceae bacterium PtaU1.Bin231]HOG16939.1 hypothetical protein [Syntrophales bacterium]